MLLNSLFFILIFWILGLIVIPSSYKLILRQYYLSVITIVFILSLFLWLGFDQSTLWTDPMMRIYCTLNMT